MGVDTATTGERINSQAILTQWRRYRESGDRRLRDRLVLTCVPMVEFIVRRGLRVLPDACEVEDLVSCGLEALIRGIDAYDPAGGATLEQYLWAAVRREMLGELRRQDSAAEAWGDRAGAKDLLLRAAGGADPELASELREARQRFRAAFRALPARGRHVLVMLYVDGLTLRETGELLGVSESRVCQIHAQLRRELRLTLADDAALLAAVA